jgi:hypothetical protein
MKKTMMELASEYMNNQEYNSLLEIFLLDYNNKSISLQQKKRVVQYINSNMDILKEEKNIPNNDLLNDVLNASNNSESYLPISKAGKIAGFLKNKADNVIMSNDKYFDFASQLENDFSVISSFDAQFNVQQFKDTLIEKCNVENGKECHQLVRFIKRYGMAFEERMTDQKSLLIKLKYNLAPSESIVTDFDSYFQIMVFRDLVSSFLPLLINSPNFNLSNNTQFDLDDNTVQQFVTLLSNSLIRINDEIAKKIRGGDKTVNSFVTSIYQNQKNLIPIANVLLDYGDKIVCISTILEYLVFRDEFSLYNFEQILGFSKRAFSAKMKEKMEIIVSNYHYSQEAKDKASLILNWSKKKK